MLRWTNCYVYHPLYVIYLDGKLRYNLHYNLLTVLTSKLPGKVYRAQVRPARRSNMIPITNGKSTASRASQNGGEHDHSSLSSSVEKEKRLD